MKKILMMMLLVTNVHAIELLNYKSTGSSVKKITNESLEALWSSEKPACIKNRSKLIGVNKAFKKLKLGYGDCSKSDDTRAIHEARGIEVVVLKLAELPKEAIAKIYK